MMIKGLDQMKKLADGFDRLQRQLPTRVGAIAVETFKGSFRRQGYIEDKTVKRWKPRQEPPAKGRRKRKLGATLVRSGDLRRSIRVTDKSERHVRVGTDVPYAQLHNEGGEVVQRIQITPKMRRFFWAMYYQTKDPKWRAMALKKGRIQRTIKMPQRQFMGVSRFLERRIEMRLGHEVSQIFKQALN